MLGKIRQSLPHFQAISSLRSAGLLVSRAYILIAVSHIAQGKLWINLLGSESIGSIDSALTLWTFVSDSLRFFTFGWVSWVALLSTVSVLAPIFSDTGARGALSLLSSVTSECLPKMKLLK